MSKFKVGDKVRVKFYRDRPSAWNSAGKMDKWMGKIVTIETTHGGASYTIKEDPIWLFNESNFEACPTREFIVIHRDGNVMTAEHRVNREVIKSAKATCNPSDVFNFDTGAKLAFDRLMGREEPKPEPKPAHKFKVGDRVIVVPPDKSKGSYGLDWNRHAGKIYTIKHKIIGGEPLTYTLSDNPNGGIYFPEYFFAPAPAPEPPKYIPKVGDRVVTKFGNGTIFFIDKFGSVAVWHDSWNLGHNIPSAVKGLSGNKGQWFTPSTLNPVAGASDV